MTEHISKKMSVSVVVPVYNEASVIGQLIDRIRAAMASLSEYELEIILVDDGSSDESLSIMKRFASQDRSIKVVELMRNYGQTSALSAGVDYAEGDIVVTMDADLQHFPEEIPHFLAKIEEGYDIVCGWRKERKENITRRLPSSTANYIIRKISGIDIHDFGTTFRAYRQEVMKKIELFGDMHRFIPALASRWGYRIAELPIQNIKRPVGKSNYTIGRTYGVALDLLFLFFYLNYLTKPLRIFGLLAILLFVPGFMIAATLIVLTYAGFIPAVKDRIALLLFSILLMILGVSFLCYGLIAEMQNRIYFAVKRDKIYNVRKVW